MWLAWVHNGWQHQVTNEEGQAYYNETMPMKRLKDPLFRECFSQLAGIERKRIVMPDNVVMRLNRGEQPEPWPLALEHDIIAKTPAFTMQQYPSYQAFYKRLSNYIGFPVEQICVGAGIEEFIRTLTFLCCEPGQTMAVTWPTCAMYEIYAKAFGVKLYKIPTHPNQALGAFVVPSLPALRLLFLPNPGQPVETNFIVSEIREIAAWCNNREVILAVDEAHWGFGSETALSLIKEFSNLVVLRTFSKLFGAASIRVGFAVGQERIIKALHAVRPSGEISGPSMHAAMVLLDDPGSVVFQRSRDIMVSRDWLRDQINNSALGLKAYGRVGFSILIDCGSFARQQLIVQELARQGILVKGGFEPPLDRHILLACGTKPLMEKFYAALSGVATRAVLAPA